ncbi:hypothetical protein D3C75_627540 [compost metagenome]
MIHDRRCGRGSTLCLRAQSLEDQGVDECATHARSGLIGPAWPEGRLRPKIKVAVLLSRSSGLLCKAREAQDRGGSEQLLRLLHACRRRPSAGPEDVRGRS